ncbi:MAG: 4Fe-4S binding protein, partial [Pseudomonadota bacterium]
MSTPDQLLLCTCAGSQSVDAASAKTATRAGTVKVCAQLCTAELAVAESALKAGETLIACGQQAGQFAELAVDLGTASPLTVDIRDRAGWTDERHAHPKQAALLAASLLPRPATPVKSVVSEGVCLVLGGDAALGAAEVLAEELAVTCLLHEAPEGLVPTDAFDIALGKVRTAAGALGGFTLKVDGYAALEPAGRGGARFAAAVDGAASQCDIIVDLRGVPALFPADHKRDGYVRADPGNPAAVERAIRAATALKGEFEKPLHVRFDAALCAHSRAGQEGCTRCLSVCPTGAISPAGEVVAIDPNICAGCGACAAVCPTGAAGLDDPPATFLFSQLSTLAGTFRAAGGGVPRVLFHDAEFGAEMVALSARFGRGLPADVVPVEVSNVESVGHAELVAAAGVGFGAISVLLSPRSGRDVPQRETALASAILQGVGHVEVGLIDVADPEGLEDALYGVPAGAAIEEPILPLGDRRQVTRLAAAALAGEDGPTVPLPEG